MSIAGNIWTSSCSNLTPADSPQMVMKECSSLDKEPAFMDRAMNRGTQGSIAGWLILSYAQQALGTICSLNSKEPFAVTSSLGWFFSILFNLEQQLSEEGVQLSGQTQLILFFPLPHFLYERKGSCQTSSLNFLFTSINKGAIFSSTFFIFLKWSSKWMVFWVPENLHSLALGLVYSYTTSSAA